MKIPFIGPMENITFLMKFNFGFSLDSSFRASENGCETPEIKILLGPFRKCISPMIFRSMIVKNAILNRIPTEAIRKSK